jgi:hypothetical protein
LLKVAAACGFAMLWIGVPSYAGDSEPRVVGWAERAILQPWGFAVQARLDTGANTASIHARSIERFELGGEPWVRFALDVDPSAGVLGPDEASKVTVELPVLRDVVIKAKGDDETPDRRPVVPLVFCLDGELYREEFGLKNREGFDYPLLLGRRFLSDRILVDSDQRFLTEPDCPALKPLADESKSEGESEG